MRIRNQSMTSWPRWSPRRPQPPSWSPRRTPPSPFSKPQPQSLTSSSLLPLTSPSTPSSQSPRTTPPSQTPSAWPTWPARSPSAWQTPLKPLSTRSLTHPTSS
ncbi:hypothetical protein K435DRAFT_870945 [Dendrothele bispora CBS 962.96]|uniref:Uncharacterized protein n=1 Tax=Dendrothele bispora (strain CBS 962.96) TaxID=1314807 RepID=A0A4S8L6N4_DENBC|nr:hypothetical protein K435DRAFT_870945 [Dendrothele bispora CBS 962.96]